MRQAIGCCLACTGALLSVPLLTLLGGCGLLGEGATNAFVAPGKFEYHNCEQLDATGRGLQGREQELMELMARAAQSRAGEFIGAVAYRTELMQTRGQLKQIAEVAERKNCVLQSKWLSDRALW
jgi:hypothetical protein